MRQNSCYLKSFANAVIVKEFNILLIVTYIIKISQKINTFFSGIIIILKVILILIKSGKYQ